MSEPKAGRIAKATPLAFRPRTKDQEATLAVWLIEGPFHPFWSRWVASAIHLRNIEGVRPAHLEAPDMTHELLIASVNPDSEVKEGFPQLGDLLTPIDQVVQFRARDDEAARRVLERVLDLVCDGASPDQDFRSFWRRVIPEIAGAVEAEGGHPCGHF